MATHTLSLLQRTQRSTLVVESQNVSGELTRSCSVGCASGGCSGNDILATTYSQVAGHILPVGDPAMLITVNVFYGNVFYIVRRAKLTWLRLVQP